jgi:hypothetical protein
VADFDWVGAIFLRPDHSSEVFKRYIVERRSLGVLSVSGRAASSLETYLANGWPPPPTGEPVDNQQTHASAQSGLWDPLIGADNVGRSDRRWTYRC